MKAFCNPLSEAEEKECFQRMQKGDLQAKEKLVLHNMRLVAHVTKKYIGSEEEPEELLSIGTIGLLKAVDSFKQEYGSRFATYAIRCIENEILMYFRSRKKSRCDISLYEPIGTDKEGNQIQMMDVLENPQKDFQETIEEKHHIERLKNEMAATLNKREMQIICERYGLMGAKPLAQREIAKKLGISRSYVSRIEKQALGKLRDLLEE